MLSLRDKSLAVVLGVIRSQEDFEQDNDKL